MGLLLLDCTGVTEDTSSRAGLNRRLKEKGAVCLAQGKQCWGIFITPQYQLVMNMRRAFFPLLVKRKMPQHCFLFDF